MQLLVTGAAGFIGSNFVRWIYSKGDQIYGKHRIVVLDKLTYAGNLANLAGLEEEYDFRFVKGDIRDPEIVLDYWRLDRLNAALAKTCWVHYVHTAHLPKSAVQGDIDR